MQDTKNTNLSIYFGKLQVPNNPIIHFIDGDERVLTSGSLPSQYLS